MSDQPTTVRGWLETLPDGLRQYVTTPDYFPLLEPCNNLEDAVEFQRDIYGEHLPEYAYWYGVWAYLRMGDGIGVKDRYRKGYYAAKAAYEAKPTPVYTSSETHDLNFVNRTDGKGVDMVLTKKPTTILEVINTLPDWSPDAEPSLKSRMTSVCSHFWNEAADDLRSVAHRIMIADDFMDEAARLFWEGVYSYFDGYQGGFFRTGGKEGYELAKATMDFAKRQEPASTNGKEYGVKEIWENSKGITPDQSAILKTAIDKWGAESQHGMAIEECAELQLEIVAGLAKFIKAARKVSRVGGREIKPEATANLIDEIADVTIMMAQMGIIYGQDAINERIAFKINRLKGRLEI